MDLVDYTPPPPPCNILHIRTLFPISTGYYIRPKKTKGNGFANVIFFFWGWGGGGRGKQGILWSMWNW